MMPDVKVNLYASFRKLADGQPSLDVSIQEGQTVGQLLDRLGIPEAETRIIFCNNRLVDRFHQLEGGETLGVFPAIGGG